MLTIEKTKKYSLAEYSAAEIVIEPQRHEGRKEELFVGFVQILKKEILGSEHTKP